MIEQLRIGRRLFAAVKKRVNEIALWISGVHSPDGSIKVDNTLEPKDSGSLALSVNLEGILPTLRARLESTRDDLDRSRIALAALTDGTSLVRNGDHYGVNAEWVRNLSREVVQGVTGGESPVADTAGNATAIASGYTGSSTPASDGGLVLLDGGGAKVQVLSRAALDQSGSTLYLFFREWTFTADGRLVSIGAEQSPYPGVLFDSTPS